MVCFDLKHGSSLYQLRPQPALEMTVANNCHPKLILFFTPEWLAAKVSFLGN